MNCRTGCRSSMRRITTEWWKQPWPIGPMAPLMVASSTSGKFYAMNGSRNRSIHRFIMNFPKGMDVDHINGDALDNRKENLRICTRSENCRNKKVRSDSKSGYKGVHQRPPNGRYQAYIGDPTRKGRHMYLGHHDSAEEAARAYDKKAIELHGEFASLNFPKDKQE